MAGNNLPVKVKIDNVVKKYSGRNGEMVALNGVSLDIHENEFVWTVRMRQVHSAEYHRGTA